MKYFKYLLLTLITIALGSCDSEEFLNPLPDSAIVANSFFQSDDDVLAGIIGAYDAVQGVNENTDTSLQRSNRGIQFEYLLTEHRTDNTRGATTEGSKADFHRYLVNSNNAESEDYYQSMYAIIFRANNILSYIDVANPSNIATYSAEARFLRAFAYFNLVRLYGDVPLVIEVLNPEDTEKAFTRVSVAAVYEQIVSDFEFAIANLNTSNSRARASVAAAQGLLAKVLMSQPSPDFSRAQQLCETIIANAQYSLQANFRDVFYNELNSEILFAVQYELGNSLESQSFSSEFTSEFRQGREDGLNIVNTNLIADFATHGGNRTAVSYTSFGDSHEVIKFLPEGSNITTNPPSYGPSPRDAGNDWIVLRYADVLLMHAEAILAGNAETTNAAAIDSYMEVRVRAGFDSVSDRPALLTKDALLLERRVELAFENHRFFDLQRFGVADAVLSAHATQMVYPDYNVRQLLLPIPAREINLSKGLLTQNPGY